MTEIRDRAKEHFPSVLLTLLSIVQALALELFWARLHEGTYPLELSWLSTIAWIQIAATVLGVVLIWVVYAGNAMRFRWVPNTSDSIYPFFIGFMQFWLIDNMHPDKLGWWLICMAAIVGVMIRVSHAIMRRARSDGSNDAYFKQFAPATRRDFYPHIVLVSTISLSGAYLIKIPELGLHAALIILFVLVLLAWQLYDAANFWDISVAVKPD